MSQAKRKHRSAGVCRRCGVVVKRPGSIRVRVGGKYCLDHRADLFLRRAKAKGFEQVGDTIDFDTFFSLTMEAYVPVVTKHFLEMPSIGQMLIDRAGRSRA